MKLTTSLSRKEGFHTRGTAFKVVDDDGSGSHQHIWVEMAYGWKRRPLRAQLLRAPLLRAPLLRAPLLVSLCRVWFRVLRPVRRNCATAQQQINARDIRSWRKRNLQITRNENTRIELEPPSTRSPLKLFTRFSVATS